jgi:hypothetical protein
MTEEESKDAISPLVRKYLSPESQREREERDREIDESLIRADLSLEQLKRSAGLKR